MTTEQLFVVRYQPGSRYGRKFPEVRYPRGRGLPREGAERLLAAMVTRAQMEVVPLEQMAAEGASC